MKLELITGYDGYDDLESQYFILCEFKDYDNNNIGLRKLRSHGKINHQYWSIEGRKGYEEWWVDILKEYDKSFNI